MKAAPLAGKRQTLVFELRINTNETFELRYDRRMSTTSQATFRIRRRPTTLDPADRGVLLADLRHRIMASWSISPCMARSVMRATRSSTPWCAANMSITSP